MPRFKKIRTGDVVTVPDALVKRYDADDRHERLPDASSGELKGKALDDALEAAGLPKSGSAAEKRQRLAAHESSQDSK